MRPKHCSALLKCLIWMPTRAIFRLPMGATVDEGTTHSVLVYTSSASASCMPN